MAKRGQKRASSDGPEHPGGHTASGVESVGSVEGAVGQFAEDIGKLIGEAQSKAESWLSQRTTILENLNSLRDTVNGLISRMADGFEAGNGLVGVRRRPRTAGAPRTPDAWRRKTGTGGAAEETVVKKKRKISAAGRKAISDAQKARWARMKKEAK